MPIITQPSPSLDILLHFHIFIWQYFHNIKMGSPLLQVNEGKYDYAISIFDKVNILHFNILASLKSIYSNFHRLLFRGASSLCSISQILQEEPDYPEALIGRGTAYAFQRELHAAIADFTKVMLE